MPWLRPALLAFPAALAALPATAQIATTQPDLNSWNASLSQQSTVRSLQQQNTSELNTLRMQNQRNVQYRPADITAGPVLGRRALGAARSQGAGRAKLGRSTGTSVCIGC